MTSGGHTYNIVLPDAYAGTYPAENRKHRAVAEVVCASLQSPLAAPALAEPCEIVYSTNVDDFIEPSHDAPIELSSDEIAKIFNVKDEASMQRNLSEVLARVGQGRGFTIETLNVTERRATRGNPETSASSVSEKQMRNILYNFPFGDGGEPTTERPQKFQRVELGLAVTTTSLCDIVVIDELTVSGKVREENGNRDLNKELILGELKNRGNYDLKQSIAQANLSMRCVLLWLRAEIGIPVESTYGFAICGPLCGDASETYLVALLKLDVPEYAGGRFTETRFILNADDTRDIGPLTALLTFLARGRRSLSQVFQKAEQACPAFYSLPNDMWNRTSQNYELVHGGASAAVFRSKLDGLRELMGPSWDLNPHLQRFVFAERVKRAVDWKRKEFPYFLKFQRAPAAEFTSFLSRNNDDEIKATYPVRPFQILENDHAFAIVMRNRGDRVTNNTFNDFDHLKTAFQTIWDTLKILCKQLPPCDTLPHNMVFDESDQRLHLIDIDEGRKAEIKARVIVDKADSRQYTSYPNYLRCRPYDYALIQAAESFVLMSNGLPSSSETDQETISLIWAQLDALRTSLMGIQGEKAASPVGDLHPQDVAGPVGHIRAAMVGLFGSLVPLGMARYDSPPS